MKPEEIGIVIVMYNPCVDDIEHVETLASVYNGVVVDNSNHRNFFSDSIGKFKYVALGKNTGIAHAQNVGIKMLLTSKDIKYVVFIDQDSKVDVDYPLSIAKEYLSIKKAFPNLALLGPMAIEQDTGEEYKSIVHKTITECNGFEKRRDVISSGSIVERTVIKNAGLLLETMFIDFVDFEWCWRLESKGYICGITKNVCIKHKVGLSSLKIWNYKIQIWSPQRYFYQFRNHLLLCLLSYVPLQWKVVTAIKNIFALFFYPFIVDNGTKCVREMWRGIFAAKRHSKSFLNEVRCILE